LNSQIQFIPARYSQPNYFYRYRIGWISIKQSKNIIRDETVPLCYNDCRVFFYFDIYFYARCLILRFSIRIRNREIFAADVKVVSRGYSVMPGLHVLARESINYWLHVNRSAVTSNASWAVTGLASYFKYFCSLAFSYTRRRNGLVTSPL